MNNFLNKLKIPRSNDKLAIPSDSDKREFEKIMEQAADYIFEASEENEHKIAPGVVILLIEKNNQEKAETEKKIKLNLRQENPISPELESFILKWKIETITVSPDNFSSDNKKEILENNILSDIYTKEPSAVAFLHMAFEIQLDAQAFSNDEKDNTIKEILKKGVKNHPESSETIFGFADYCDKSFSTYRLKILRPGNDPNGTGITTKEGDGWKRENDLQRNEKKMTEGRFCNWFSSREKMIERHLEITKLWEKHKENDGNFLIKMMSKIYGISDNKEANKTDKTDN